MDVQKTFIGFDLGDGESITDYVNMGMNEVSDAIQTTFIPMTMPGSNTPGSAIPTVFGYDEDNMLLFSNAIVMMPDLARDVHVNFKRRPGDLIKNLTEQRRNELLLKFDSTKSWPSDQDCNGPEMIEFRDSVVTFTNSVFENPVYYKKVHDTAIDSQEIVFCVGHPTKWDELDVAIYKAILRMTVLGRGNYAEKKTSLIVEKESRAAYLTVKDKAKKEVLPKGTSAVLCDIGSSTLDVTAITADSHNYQYNGGNNYLGVRSIDYLIRDLYLEKLKEDPHAYKMYEKLLRQNPSMEEATLLACRIAKEDMYSAGIGMANVNLGSFAPVRIRQKEVDEIIKNRAVAEVLRDNANMPGEQFAKMGKKSWLALFEEFLEEQKKEIASRKIRIGRVILTGSASKMPFIHETVQKVFHELPAGGILEDMNPSRSISMGLALVGPSNEKSIMFQKDVRKLLDQELTKMIEDALPQLADSLGAVIEEVISAIIKGRMKDWKNGYITTLNQMTARIEDDCSSENLQKVLEKHAAYNKAMSDWTENVLGKDIAVKLQSICQKHGVKNFTLDELNILKIPTISIGTTEVGINEMMDVIVALISIIAGIITSVVLPAVLGIVIGLISMISTAIALFLLDVLLAIPVAGWAVLTVVAGVTIVKAAAKGLGRAKEELVEKLRNMDLPEWVRKRLSDEKINSEIAKCNIKAKVKDGILESKSKKEITKSVRESLEKQILKRADEIKYVIESR